MCLACIVHLLTMLVMLMKEMVLILGKPGMIPSLNQCGRESMKWLSGYLTLSLKH